MGKNVVIFRGDWNDADYVTEVFELTNEELVKFRKGINLLNKVFDNEDISTSIDNALEYDTLTNDEREALSFVQDHIPYGYEGAAIHNYDVTVYTNYENKEHL